MCAVGYIGDSISLYSWSDYSPFTEETGENNRRKYVCFCDYTLLQYDEDAAYKEYENQNLFGRLRQSHWELCDTERKIELLQELADFETRKIYIFQM